MARDCLLIVGDFNGDVHSHELQDCCTSLGMHKIFAMEHSDLPSLSTFSHGTQMGCSPIDGVWLSHGVLVQACSWMSFSNSPGDHQVAIVDFDIVSLLGQPHLQVCQPPARCLVCTLLATRDRYVALLMSLLEKYQFLSKLYKLHMSMDPHNAHLQTFSKEYEHLDQICIEGMWYAEKCCCCLHMGLLAYLPTLMLL